MSDTIAAIATPIGEGGISIIRCSGSGALTVAQKIFYTSTGNSVNEALLSQSSLWLYI